MSQEQEGRGDEKVQGTERTGHRARPVQTVISQQPQHSRAETSLSRCSLPAFLPALFNPPLDFNYIRLPTSSRDGIRRVNPPRWLPLFFKELQISEGGKKELDCGVEFFCFFFD